MWFLHHDMAMILQISDNETIQKLRDSMQINIKSNKHLNYVHVYENSNMVYFKPAIIFILILVWRTFT